MEEYNEKYARMSNHSFIKQIDQAAAVLDDELKAISEVDKINIDTSVYADEDVFEEDDDDDLTGELANLNSLAALQQELNMSALSFEEFNANNTSKASTSPDAFEGEDAVITDVGEIQIGDAIMEETSRTPWKLTRSLSQDNSIRSEQKTSQHQDSVHRFQNVDGDVNEIVTQSSDDSEDSSVFETSSHTSGVMHLLNQDRLDIALSPIRFNPEEAEHQHVPSSQPRATRDPSTAIPYRELFVDTTNSSVNTMDVQQQQQECEDATPKIQNTGAVAKLFQFQDEKNSDSVNENSADLQVCKSTPKMEKETEVTPKTPTEQHPHNTQPVTEPSPMSLLNTLLASPEARFFSEEEAPEVQSVATSESSNTGGKDSFSSQTSDKHASLSSPSSISATSTSSSVSSTSMGSTKSADKKKWNPTRLFKQKNFSSESQRKSIFSKPSSKSKKKKSKLRLRSSPPPVLPTVSEDVALPPAQAESSPTNITRAPPHDPNENEIRQTLGMKADSTSNGGRGNSLFNDNKECVAVNRMMKMLMEQRQKNKTQERRERKLLHMLCDARNDRMQLIDEHKRDMQDLERKMKTSFENNEILRQENELLLMQTEAWKQISRQSNQTAALYKFTFDERQSHPLYQAPIGETMEGRSKEESVGAQGSLEEEYDRKLEQAQKEKEELEEKLKQFEKESVLELENVKYQATLVKRELDQVQTIFEAKLENYMLENAKLKEETTSLQNELEQSNAQVTDARKERKLDSDRPKMLSEITNLRLQKLEVALSQMQNNHETAISNSNLDMTNIQVRIKDLERSLDESNAQQHKAEEEMVELQDQLSRERRSRSTSTRIFLQQNESLAQENRSLQENVKKVEDELERTRVDHERIEAELVKERKEVHRLEKQAEYESEFIKELQEELDSLQTKLDEAENRTLSPSKNIGTPQVERIEAQATFDQEILAAENEALRATVARLEVEVKSKPTSTQTSSTAYSSTYNSPVERRVRSQVLRLRSSMQQKREENSLPPSSPFFTDSPSVTLTGKSRTQKSLSPSMFVTSMLRPKAKARMDPKCLNKENASFMSPQRRKGEIGLSARSASGLGIR